MNKFLFVFAMKLFFAIFLLSQEHRFECTIAKEIKNSMNNIPTQPITLLQHEK